MKTTIIFALAVLCLTACADRNAQQNETPKIGIDSIALSLHNEEHGAIASENPTDSADTADSALESKIDSTDEKQDEDPNYTTRRLRQIELKIPNAIDTISSALGKFSPQYRDWTYYLLIPSNKPNQLDIIGEKGGRYINLFLEEHFIEKIGYVTVNGVDMDLNVFHKGGDFNDINIDSLIEFTGKSKEFVYETNRMIIVDAGVECYLKISDSGLTIRELRESW